MSSQIMLRDAAAPADPNSDLDLRWENTINTPILSAVEPVNGTAVAGAYTIVGASTGSVDVTAEDPKNELVGTGIAVVADGVTVNHLGFADIVFSSSLAVGWTGRVSIGSLMATDGSTSKRLDVGIVESGDSSTQRRVTATNVGTQSSASTQVYALPGFILKGTAIDSYIAGLKNHTDPTRQGLAVPASKVITFADYKVGPPETADVLVDAVKTIEDAILDGRFYQYGDTGYIDAVDGFLGLAIAFVLNPGDPTTKTFTLDVRDSSEWIEFAPDVAGSPGTWQAGPLDLTESGQPTGVISASGQVNFWRRAALPGSAAPGDMRQHRYRVRGLTV